jgi:hypothetical protein
MNGQEEWMKFTTDFILLTASSLTLKRCPWRKLKLLAGMRSKVLAQASPLAKKILARILKWTCLTQH